jgi:ADP-ribosylglycohydrolase
VSLQESYLEQVYAAVLGKVIGVYVGRPFEGWAKKSIEAKFGEIDRYVHEEQDSFSEKGVPLVVADDDITGTFTFVRALEDSGDYADTHAEFFGDTWLNYLVENRTILWWGGMGHSTEHTAYLRLKNGIKAPRSGSIALNSKIVAEQIGAQIFIDAFGMVAPGNPALAVSMAEKAAQVSHDGEAVYAARVVAAMVSAAFVEKDMGKLLDIGVGFIPQDSLISEVHRDVRSWCVEDRDWRKTYQRIDEKYGYHCYGGNCHVIPNHALMVMAWSYAPDNFHESQKIINTAGWDTDCNAANVGSVMGLIVGLEGINRDYEFQQPTADRLLMPTAEGTEGVTDCAIIARRVEAIGRKIMGWSRPSVIKEGAWHSFELPGSMHGYMVETDSFNQRHTCEVRNVAGQSKLGSRSMHVDFSVDRARTARVSTPLIRSGNSGGYSLMGSPKIYPGNIVRVTGSCGATTNPADLRLFVRAQGTDELLYSSSHSLQDGQGFDISLTVPGLPLGLVRDFGLELSAESVTQGDVFVDAVFIEGTFDVAFPTKIHQGNPWKGNVQFDGWVFDADLCRGKFSDDEEEQTQFGKNEGRGELICGSTLWRDYCFEARIKIHLATKAGIVARYQGKQRYLSVEIEGNLLRLVQRNYREVVLGEYNLEEQGRQWEQDKLYSLQIRCSGTDISVYLEGDKILEGQDDRLLCGGAGFMFENGIMGARDIRCVGLAAN